MPTRLQVCIAWLVVSLGLVGSAAPVSLARVFNGHGRMSLSLVKRITGARGWCWQGRWLDGVLVGLLRRVRC